jgi:hypothetical protein
MAATSKHYGDVSNWILKVIESCETQSQEIAARKLVQLFQEQYSDLAYPVYRDLCRGLRDKLDNKFYSRMDKLSQKITNPE